jgi:hypothetical protein
VTVVRRSWTIRGGRLPYSADLPAPQAVTSKYRCLIGMVSSLR